MPGAVSFLHPGLALAGLAAGVIPLLIHLLNRRRHRRVPWAAMDFLLAAAQRRSRRMRLAQWLLFLARVLTLVIVGAALARPYVTQSRLLGLGPSHVHRVILLDNSGSMGATSADGKTVYDRARSLLLGPESRVQGSESPPQSPIRNPQSAIGPVLSPQSSALSGGRSPAAVVRGLLDSFPATDEVSVVSLAAPGAAVIEYPSFDRRRIRDALAQVPLTQRPTDLAGGLDRALELLDKSSAAPGNRYVYVVSDLANHVWFSESYPQSAIRSPSDALAFGSPLNSALSTQHSPLPTPSSVLRPPSSLAEATQRVAERAVLALVPIGEVEANNVGLEDLTFDSTITVVGAPMRFVAHVVNYGGTEVRGAVLHVSRDERVERRIPLPTLEPGRRETVSFSVVFDTPRSHALHVHLETGSTDRLALDNDRYLALEVLEAVKVLVVDGAPGKTRLAGQAGYLLTALNPWDPTGKSGSGADHTPPPSAFMLPKAISHLDLAREVLSDYQVVVLCNVERLPEEFWGRLQRYVEEGGGLLVFAGESLDVAHYNRFGYAAKGGLLPGLLKPAEGELRREGVAPPALQFAARACAHPVVAEFAGLPSSGLFAARVERHVPLVADEAAVEIVLRYTNQEPAMAIRRCGAGRCGFVTTTADMAWTNLPAKGDYVSLMTNLVAYLGQPPNGARNLEVGQPLVRRLKADEAALPLRIRLPSQETRPAMASVTDSSVEFRYDGTESAGLYTTLVGDTPQMVAVNPPAAEGDLKRVYPAELTKAIDAPFIYAADLGELWARTGQSAARELGSGLVYAVLLLLLGETWLAMRHDHPPECGVRNPECGM